MLQEQPLGVKKGQSCHKNCFSSMGYIPLETNEQTIMKYPECIIMDSAILVSSVHQNLKLLTMLTEVYSGYWTRRY